MKDLLSISFGIFAVLGILGLGYMHESSHVQIFRYYGIDSHIVIDFPDMRTVPDKEQFYLCNDSCIQAQGMADAFAYPLLALYLMISFGIFIIISAIELVAEIMLYNDKNR